MLKSLKLLIFSVLLLTVISTNANAGPFADALGKCVVQSTTPEDKFKLMKWIFYAMLEHPNFKSIAEVSEWDKVTADKSMADLLTRLLSIECKAEVKEAVKYEKESAIESAFSLLGEVAGREIMIHPNVAKSSVEFIKFLDEEKMNRLLSD